MAIGVGRQLISSVVLHGGSFSKYSFHKRLYAAKSSFMLVRNTVTSTIFSHEEPASSKIHFTFWNTLRTCVSMS